MLGYALDSQIFHPDLLARIYRFISIQKTCFKRLFIYDNVLIYEIRGREEFNAIVQNVTKDDCFIFISFSGESPNVTDFAQQLQLRDIPLVSITKLHDNTLASLSTVNLYVSPARFQLDKEGDGRPPFQSMMPYFLLLEIWYVKYRMYLHQKEMEEPQDKAR